MLSTRAFATLMPVKNASDQLEMDRADLTLSWNDCSSCREELAWRATTAVLRAVKSRGADRLTRPGKPIASYKETALKSGYARGCAPAMDAEQVARLTGGTHDYRNTRKPLRHCTA
jgi:hypothetical protein